MADISSANLETTVRRAIDAQGIVDMHTHVYPPSFGTPLAGAGGRADHDGLMLWGIDELLTYHYLVAEVFRVVPASVLPYEQFWKMSKRQQADHIWKHLFLERSPASEACRGVLTAISKLGLDPSDRDLNRWRKYFDEQDPGKHIDRCMEVSGVVSLTMTNNVFDDNERQRWLANPQIGADPRFKAVLRIDPLIRDWSNSAPKLSAWGYVVEETLTQKTVEECRRFLHDWFDRIKAIYLAVSLPPDWRYPVESSDPQARTGQNMLEQVILPVCAERGLPFAMMIGATRAANPALRDAGDMSSKSHPASLVNLCRQFNSSKFLVTMLAREDQHELCVVARKFGNLMIFGCWWFLNNPSLIEEITRMRLELLGTSFIPQHSDARVLDQIIYKWDHSKRIIGTVLCNKYRDLLATGWKLTDQEIERDVRHLLSDNFLAFLKR
jgi:hypothetical protein